MELKKKSNSLNNFGTRLLSRLFSTTELTDTRFSVTGGQPKGVEGDKLALDPDKILYIRTLCYYFSNLPVAEFDKIWISIKNSLNKKISDIRKAAR